MINKIKISCYITDYITILDMLIANTNSHEIALASERNVVHLLTTCNIQQLVFIVYKLII